MHRLLRIAALVVAAGALEAAPGEVGIAVVHSDGRLQPLARVEGDNWTPLPPADAAGDWSLWLFDDPVVKTSPFAARAARPISAAAACAAVRGLDAVAAPPAASAAVPSRLGVAVRGTDIRPDLPVAVAADSELGRELAARAAAAFHRAEDETLTLEAEGPGTRRRVLRTARQRRAHRRRRGCGDACSA